MVYPLEQELTKHGSLINPVTDRFCLQLARHFEQLYIVCTYYPFFPVVESYHIHNVNCVSQSPRDEETFVYKQLFRILR